MVDDDADARDIVRRILEGFGAQVVLASSTSEALRALQQEKPAVLVSDIGMPDADGYELIRQIRALPTTEAGRNTPAIALTAYARSEDRSRALDAGYQMFLPKPVTPDELLSSIVSLTKAR